MVTAGFEWETCESKSSWRDLEVQKEEGFLRISMAGKRITKAIVMKKDPTLKFIVRVKRPMYCFVPQERTSAPCCLERKEGIELGELRAWTAGSPGMKRHGLL